MDISIQSYDESLYTVNIVIDGSPIYTSFDFSLSDLHQLREVVAYAIAELEKKIKEAADKLPQKDSAKE